MQNPELQRFNDGVFSTFRWKGLSNCQKLSCFSPDADVWLPGHAYIKKTTCLWAVEKPTALFCFARGKQNVSPLSPGRGLLLAACASPGAGAWQPGPGAGASPLQLSHFVAWGLFVLDKAFLVCLDFGRCQLCMMYHPEQALYRVSKLNRGSKAESCFSRLHWEPGSRFDPSEGCCRVGYLFVVCSSTSQRDSFLLF